VELMKSGIPSTGLPPWTKTLPLPIRSHPCKARLHPDQGNHC
jgi:hypothetical protein